MRYALKASADYVLLLNNDTVVDEYFLYATGTAQQIETPVLEVIGPKNILMTHQV